MLKHKRFDLSEKAIWADLGCGSGTFTLALAGLLGQGSLIHALDKDKTALLNIPATFAQTTIETWASDFTSADFPFGDVKLDGILMTNSLHYVKDQATFIAKAKQWLKPSGRFLIVEYDSARSNPWVPYPLTFFVLTQLFSKAGYTTITKLHESPSFYSNAMMYAALVEA